VEAISAEEIEQMEDFVFRLSDSQLIEWKTALKLKQPFIFNMFANSIQTNKETNEQNRMFYLVFTVLKCLDVYGIEVPFITDKELNSWDKKWKTQMMKGLGELHLENLVRVGNTVNQGVLSKYIYDKFMEIDAPITNISYPNTQLKANTLCFVVLMYGSKIEERLKHQNNPKYKR